MQSKHEVYGHVLETHLAIAQEEVVSQYDFDEETMDTGLETEIPRNETGSQEIESEPTDIRVYSFFELNVSRHIPVDSVPIMFWYHPITY